MARLFTNLRPSTTLNGGIDAVETELIVIENTEFAAAFAGEPFAILIDNEIMEVTSRQGGGDLEWTVTRGFDGTDADSHEDAAIVKATVIAADIAAGVEAGEDLATHAAAGDPHTGYRLESADHSHASTGAQAGQLDHGLALTGLSDDDHPQYILKTLAAAKGDLFAASANDTPAILTAGADDTILMADSGQATGLKYIASAAGGASAPGDSAAAGTADTFSRGDHVHSRSIGEYEVPIVFSRSGVLTTYTGTHRFYFPWNATIAHVEISVGTAPTGAAVIVDVNVNGTTIFTTQSNRPEIAISGFVDQSGAIEDANHDDGQYITIDIDQIGSTIAGSDLTVIILIKKR